MLIKSVPIKGEQSWKSKVNNREHLHSFISPLLYLKNRVVYLSAPLLDDFGFISDTFGPFSTQSNVFFMISLLFNYFGSFFIFAIQNFNSSCVTLAIQGYFSTSGPRLKSGNSNGMEIDSFLFKLFYFLLLCSFVSLFLSLKINILRLLSFCEFMGLGGTA